MTTIHEAIALAKQEQAAGFIRSYYVENGKVYAESTEGGLYVWFTDEPVRHDPHFDI